MRKTKSVCLRLGSATSGSLGRGGKGKKWRGLYNTRLVREG